MIISSRTPDGRPNRCPVCGANVWIEPSAVFGDAPCPQCGCLLWFIGLGSKTRLFEYEKSEELRERLMDRVCENLGVNKEALNDPDFLKEVGPDSLDIVELVMELDEELGDSGK